MYGADVRVDSWVSNNLLPALLGNFIGGGIIVGGFVTLMYSWSAPLPHTWITKHRVYLTKISAVRRGGEKGLAERRRRSDVGGGIVEETERCREKTERCRGRDR